MEERVMRGGRRFGKGEILKRGGEQDEIWVQTEGERD